MSSTAQAAAADSAVLEGLRRRGQFLISGMLWAAAAGLLFVFTGWAIFVYHYTLAFAERVRTSLGFARPGSGPDWFLLAILAAGPILTVIAAILLASWYRRIWSRRLRAVWPERRSRARHSRWEMLPHRASQPHRARRTEYLTALLASDAWCGVSCSAPADNYEACANALLLEMERDVAERALTTGLTVGLSRNRYLDLFTIFAAALELQLHVLSRLGKRPSWHAWRLLIQRCGASLFLNSYLNRQDALSLNLMIKKAGMGLYASGDLMENAAHHLSESDFDLDEALNLQHGGLLGMATKGIELGATMALTVGQVGLHVLGSLIESVGDELAQGALAAGIIYYHGMALAADTLALDRVHRASPEMTRSFREAIWKMGEIAGSILRDVVRQRRSAFRERRRQMVRSLPKSAYLRIQNLFGKKAETAQPG
ncbi:MAG TPA: hypothetical protein VKX25_01045 [Bryobacteraceae bacterium]|jgi:hypothetical protein|nr:hypothetical protein [Bryobacteraceae bacterium]